MSFIKNKIWIILLFLVFWLSGCNNKPITNNVSESKPTTKIENNYFQQTYVNPEDINTINKILTNDNSFSWFNNIDKCKNITVNWDNKYWLITFEKNLCVFNVEINNYFKDVNQNTRYKKLYKHNQNVNEKLTNYISTFFSDIKENKKFYKQVYLKNIWLIKNNIYDNVIKKLNKDNRELYLVSWDVKKICNIIVPSWKKDKIDKCIYSFSWYQHLDICKFINNNKLKDSCYNRKISQCKNIVDEQWEIMCIYNTLLYVKDDNRLLSSISDPSFSALIKKVINSKKIIGSRNLRKKEQHDIDIFKSLTWNIDNKNKCEQLYYDNNKLQCNIFYNILSNQNYKEKNINIWKTWKKTSKDINDIINNICSLDNIDKITQNNNFKNLKDIINKDKFKLKVVSEKLYSNCINHLGYIWTEEIFMDLIRQDNLTIVNKIKIVINYLNKNKDYLNNLKTKKTDTLNYQISIISMMLYKYKYWKYNWKPFFLNRLIDNLLYKRIINDIHLRLSDDQLLKLINKRYNLNLVDLDKKVLLDVIITNIKNDSNYLLKNGSNFIINKQILHKTLSIKQTWKGFDSAILGLKYTNNIITDEYLLMYLFPDKIFNDTVRRQNFMNMKWLNWYFIENLFRYYRLKWKK